MRYVYFGLLCEGPTDRAALPALVEKALVELLGRNQSGASISWDIDVHAGKSSDQRLQEAIASGRHDVLLVHRDGAGDPHAVRSGLLERAPTSCPIVPVRELEAWLIVDPEAIRRATRAPRSVELPARRRPGAVERVRDPKLELSDLLARCLGACPPRDEIEEWYALVAEHVDPVRLRQVSWYARLGDDLQTALAGLGWPLA